MKAQLQPLKGKYYGTIIRITEGPWAEHDIRIWISCGENGIDPSVRELAAAGVTQEQWDNNEQIGNYPQEAPRYDWEDYTPGAPILAQEALGIYDSHFEGRTAYEAAVGLLKVLEGIKDNRDKSDVPPAPNYTAGLASVFVLTSTCRTCEGHGDCCNAPILSQKGSYGCYSFRPVFRTLEAANKYISENQLTNIDVQELKIT